MALDKKVIELAVNKKYTEFSSAIKDVLHSKMANTDEVTSYMSEYDRIHQMKQSFADINSNMGG